jgi:thymidylate synthase (FAD)
MGHTTVPAAEALLDKEIRVLDHGFVRLVDYMGGDARIVQTARVSYGAGTKTVREDAGLIDYLMRHRHTSPFEHVVMEFHCKLPIFVARQWIRHRTARLNEISGRYSVMADEFYVPPLSQIRKQSADNKQGRDAAEVPRDLQRRVLDLLKEEQHASYATYQALLKDDLARELARINLPLSLYTEWYWQMDLHNLFHFLALRMDAHAQWEIRQYAEAIATIARAVAPMAYESFERHVLLGSRLSVDEMDAVRALLRGESNPLTGRRLAEFEAKLRGRPAPDELPPPPPRVSRRPSEPAPRREPQPPAAAPDDSPDAGATRSPAEPSSMIHGWRTHWSSEEINQLPLRQYDGPVQIVSDDAAVPDMMRALHQERVLGFDTESRPAFQRGQSFPVSLIQFATVDTVYLVQIQQLQNPERIWTVFGAADVIKTGVAIQHDLRKLGEMAEITPAGFVDLATIATRMGFKKTGLRGLAAAILGIRVSKGAQRSNWAREALTEAQVRYAATDAWVAREIYLAIAAREDASA